MNLNDLPDMSDALKQVQMYEKKKLDPVGKEDGDIDNDGDKDSSDSYLLNRRKTVTKAMGKKTHLCAKMVKKEGKEYQTIPEQHTMLEDGTVTHYDITDGETILENVPVEELEILVAEAHEHFDNYDKNAEVLGEAGMHRDAKTGEVVSKAEVGKTYYPNMPKKKTSVALRKEKEAMKKEAFAFSEAELEELALHEEEIDALTDEQLIEFFEEAILEMAEDDQDLIEICEHLEEVEMLSEDYYDSAVKASKAASKTPEAKAGRRNLRMQRLKKAAAGAAKKVGSAAKAAAAKAKPVAKAAAKGAARGAGYAAGLAKRAAKSAKSEFAKGKERGEKGSGGSSSSSKPASSSSSSSSDDDGTDGKLDSVLSSIRGSKGTSSGGGSSSASSGGGGKKKGPGLLRKAGRLVKKGLKKAVGKTSRLISKGSDKLAKRLGEDYDKIAHLHESGLFSIQEIENVIEEGYKEIDRSKENKMYRRAGNLARTGLSSKGKKKEDALNKSNKIVSAIARQKENERFKKMGDEKARSNYGG